jgi:predicted nucleotidyltransferase
VSVEIENLPDTVRRVLSAFVDAASEAFGSELESIVLYGSAAEGRMRKTSDVNMIVVLKEFSAERADRLREPLRSAYAAIRLEAMFVLERELGAAVEAFAVKFADVLHRRRVLYGPDPFETLKPSRAAELLRLKQVLLNLILRLRQGYLLRSLRDEQAAKLVADTAGPLRTCAEVLLELQGEPAESPKRALERFASSLPEERWALTLERLSLARESGTMPAGTAAGTVLDLLALASKMHREAEALR